MHKYRWLACLLGLSFLLACVTTIPVPTPTQAPTATFLPITATLEPSWTTVGSNLATDPSWTSQEVKLDFDIQVVDGTLVVVAPADVYANPIDTTGPHLQLSGDFGVEVVLKASTGDFAGISLYGALAQGEEWWQGITRLDVGIKGGKVAVGYWDGSSPTPTFWQEFSAAGVYANNQVSLTVFRLGDTFFILADGRTVGQLLDPGLFAAGNVYFGLNVFPKNHLILYVLRVAANNGSDVTIVH